MMESHCAWCEQDGQPSFLKMVPGPEGLKTHGICPVHLAAMRAELPAPTAHPAVAR